MQKKKWTWGNRKTNTSDTTCCFCWIKDCVRTQIPGSDIYPWTLIRFIAEFEFAPRKNVFILKVAIDFKAIQPRTILSSCPTVLDWFTWLYSTGFIPRFWHDLCWWMENGSRVSSQLSRLWIKSFDISMSLLALSENITIKLYWIWKASHGRIRTLSLVTASNLFLCFSVVNY